MHNRYVFYGVHYFLKDNHTPYHTTPTSREFIMKTALILGITGGFGSHVAAALIEDGWQVRALARDPGRLAPWQKGIEAIRGDARNIADIRHAARGVDVIVYGLNIPYQRWERDALPLLEPSVTVAEESGLRLVFPGNVYVYDPATGPDFTETAPHHPPTRKGVIRQRMEQRLQQASQRGARVLIVRAGDFIGANADGSWMKVLTKSTKHGHRLLRPGPAHLPHTWANLPDLGRTVARLLAREERLDDFSTFHFEGYRITFEQLVRAMESASGRPVKVSAFPWWAVRLAAPFVPFLRELQKMRYLWQQQVNLDGSRLRASLGNDVPETPLPRALLEAGLVAPTDDEPVTAATLRRDV
jgi:nucleoside-diphosphate-sugar epimerase